MKCNKMTPKDELFLLWKYKGLNNGLKSILQANETSMCDWWFGLLQENIL